MKRQILKGSDRIMKRNLVFNFNRFSVNEILTEWVKADKSKDLIVLESVHSDWSIEVDGIRNLSEHVFENFLSRIDEFDHKVQLYCKEAYEKGNYKIENYLVTLEWISVQENSITMGYWGDHVNVELRSNIEYENGSWKQTEIFYQ